MVRTVSLDHAVKEFYNAVWKAVSIKKKIDSGEALRCVGLLKKYLDKTCS